MQELIESYNPANTRVGMVCTYGTGYAEVYCVNWDTGMSIHGNKMSSLGVDIPLYNLLLTDSLIPAVNGWGNYHSAGA